MNEISLLTGLGVLTIIALSIIFYPLKSHRRRFILLPLGIVFLSLLYWQLGAMPQWLSFLKKQASQAQLDKALAKIKSPDDLIIKLRSRLDDSSKSTRGWYLLGRLLASQNRWAEANEAFAKAHQFAPEEERITVNYVQSLWQINHQQMNAEIRSLCQLILQKNAQQPDILALLGMDAYRNEHYHKAIDYWQRLLKITPNESEEALFLQKAINKAKNKERLAILSATPQDNR